MLENTTKCLCLCWPRRPFGSLTPQDLLLASFSLAAMDNVLLLGRQYDDLNHVAMRRGMGWRMTLRDRRMRW